MIRLLPRVEPLSPRARIAIPVAAVAMALAAWSGLVAADGKDPRVAWRAIGSTFTTPWRLTETALRATPIVLCAAGVALAASVSLWNVGAQGQLLAGAVAATWLALSHDRLPPVILLPAILALSAAAGALVAALPGFLRARFGASEILSTLLLNYVLADVVLHLIQGPWRDPDGFKYTPLIPRSSWLPAFEGSNLHAGVLAAVLVPCALYLVWRRTVWGYEGRVVGDSWSAARYAGIPLRRRIVSVMAVSGALAGLAGGIELAGHAHRLQPELAPGYGYTAILVAFLAGRNILGTVVVGFLFAGLLVAGGSIQVRLGVPEASIRFLEALVLVAVLAGQGLEKFEISLGRRRPRETTAA